jgi:electron transfer flavoprotein alpha subunit
MSDVSAINVLVLVEHDNHHLANATLHVLGAAQKLAPARVDVLLVGQGCAAVAGALTHIPGISHVLCIDGPGFKYPLAEIVAPLLAQWASGYSHVLVAATTTGKNIAPRAAALLDIQPVSDVIAIIDPVTFKRPIYAGSAIATIASDEPIQLLTIRTSAFDAVDTRGGAAPIQDLPVPVPHSTSRFLEDVLNESERPELTAARIVISGGRGMKSAENFALLYALADKLGAAVGASRAAVDAGFVPNDMQVGQTGKIVAPELYIAVGISGAVQHLAGMKESKVIVAINKDPDAPIFQVADYGLVADLFDALPELTTSI